MEETKRRVMNPLFELLEELHSLGLSLTEDGTMLKGDRSRVTPELLAKLKAHKEELVALYAGLKEGCTVLGWMVNGTVVSDVQLKKMVREIAEHNAKYNPKESA